MVSRLVYSCHEMVWSVDLYTLVSGGLRQLFAKPRRIVVRAALGVRSTILAVPERVVWIKHIAGATASISRLAEVIFSDKQRSGVCSATGTVRVIVVFCSK